MEKIPVIINNRDLLTWPKAMVERIQHYDGVGEIIIIDNASTYEPLLDWYNTSPCRIVYGENIGVSAPWISKVVEDLKAEYYVVTDPDMGLEDTPNDTLLYLKDKLESMKEFQKVGLGLDWKRVREDSPYYQHLQRYEKNRWEKSDVQNDVHVGVQIDTTFALYCSEWYFIGGGSTSAPYIARHYPWEFSLEEARANEEFKYYIDHATNASSYKVNIKL